MTAITDSYVLGISPTPDNNFLLDTDGAGALRVRRRADGSGGLLLNVAADGKITLPSQPASAYSMVRVDTQGAGAAGNGTTNTKIPRWTQVRINQGSDITYTDSVVNGASFIAVTSGIYSINFTHSAGSPEGCCITLNESAGTLNSNASLVAVSEVLQFGDSWATSAAASVSWTGYLAAGSVIRPHTSGGLSATPRSMFTIAKVSP